ncbi:MAG: hypothetical protein ABIF71_08530 [Planctomycetota bacterium]
MSMHLAAVTAWIGLALAAGPAPAVGAPPVETVIQKGHNGNVYSMVYSPDGRIICSASVDGTVKMWDAVTCKEMRTFIAAGLID